MKKNTTLEKKYFSKYKKPLIPFPNLIENQLMIIWDKNRVLREISSAQEIYESPAYIRVLDKNLHELNEIIGIYKLREDDEEVLCGFKDCRTRHQKGYLISTKSGNTANIGNFCGRKIFGG